MVRVQGHAAAAAGRGRAAGRPDAAPHAAHQLALTPRRPATEQAGADTRAITAALGRNITRHGARRRGRPAGAAPRHWPAGAVNLSAMICIK